MPRSAEVDQWFADFEHPLEDVMQAVREVFLSDERISETIKWKSPTFIYEGNLASINPRTKAHVSVLFHTGAKIPGDHPLLQGGAQTARYARFNSIDDVGVNRRALLNVVESWCESR